MRRVFESCGMLALFAGGGLLGGCSPDGPAGPDAAGSIRESGGETRGEIQAIDAGRLAQHIAVLASDEFEGRAPASRGEDKTIAYLRAQFDAIGLEPASAGSYFQPVPLITITADPAARLKIAGADGALEFAYGVDMIAWTRRVVTRAALDASELVFVGYGIVAPEYGWNDYDGIDMSGKTALILANDPGFQSKQPELFRGNAMTYYGRWTYKYEEAARQGAEGAIIVHESGAAGYPWEVVAGSWSGPQFHLDADGAAVAPVTVEAWITHKAAERVFNAAGRRLSDARTGALERENAAATPLGLSASIVLENTTGTSVSHNVVGYVPGRVRPDETIVYMAHWDHLGRDPRLEGDQIFNGAVDNASGVAGLLELARVFSSLEPPPERSIVFMALTGEESGLLGSRYYARHPLFPLTTTVAAINMDGLNVDGPTRDVAVIGHGSSELEEYLNEEARAQGRFLVPEPTPEKGYFFRSDHFSLAIAGVPVLYAESGVDNLRHGERWGRRRAWEYTAIRYHKPADEYDPDWDLSGAVEDIELYFNIGVRLAMEERFPEWYEGNAFSAAREASRRGK